MCKYAQIATAAIKSTFLTGKTCPHFASVSEKINMFQNDTFLWFWVGEQIEKYGGATCRLETSAEVTTDGFYPHNETI